MITLQKLTDGNNNEVAYSIIIDEKESMEAFKTLVFRATNLWPDAPPEIKEFADELDHGKILQDYRGQDTSKR